MGVFRRKQTFKVPRKTISDYIKGSSKIGKAQGRPTALSYDQELEIVNQIIESGEKGFPLTRQQVLHKIGQAANKLKIHSQFKNGRPGLAYWRGQKSRFPQLTVKCPEGTETVSRAVSA